MDLKSIQEILKFVNKSDLTEVLIEEKDFKLRVEKKAPEMVHVAAVPQVHQVQPASMPAPQPQAQQTQQQVSAPAEKKDESTSEEGNVYTFKSPIIGTFYRSPSPDKDAYVKVGDSVQKGDVLCIIEAMKLFNEIESEIDGRIVKILVENAQPVEYDQPLFLIEPAK